MDYDKIQLFFELRKQRILVGDGDLPLLRDGRRSPIDFRSVSEYRNYLAENEAAVRNLRNKMTEREIKAGEIQFAAWYREYLRK